MSKAPRPRVRKPCVFLQNYSVVTTWDTGGDRSSLRHLPGRDVAQGEDVCLRLRVRTRQNLRSRHSPQPTAFCESVRATNGSSGKEASDRGELGGAGRQGRPSSDCFLRRPHACGREKPR